MGFSVTIGGVAVTPEHGSLKASQDIGRRSTANLRVLDVTGANHYGWGMPLVVYDPSANNIFSGFIDTCKEKRPGWAAMLTSDITVADNHYLADKRRAAKVYGTSAAGDMVSDLSASYLSGEGVIGRHIYLALTTQSDFNANGTFVRTQSTTNNTGDVELTLPVAPTFTRATVAYHSTGGTSIASGTARYDTLASRQGLWLEEGTTNLFSANQSDIETDTTGFGTTGTGTTIARDTGTFYYNTASIKTITTGAASSAGVTTNGISGTALTTYAAGVWVKGTNGDLLKFIVKDNTNNLTTTVNFTANGSWQWITGTLTFGAVTGATGLQLKVLNQGATANTFYCDGWQIEQKAFATNWQVGGTTRNRETLTMPVSTVGVNPSIGTFAAWVYVTAATKDTSETRWLFDARNSGGTTNQLNIQRSTSGQWQIGTASGANGAADALAVGWHRFVLTWTGGTYTLYIDGTQFTQRTNQTNATGIDTVSLGSRYTLGAGSANALFASVRFEDYAWSAANVTSDYGAGGFTTVGANTIYYLALAGALTTGTGGYYTYALDVSKVGNIGTAPSSTYHTTTTGGETSTIQFSKDGQATYTSYASGATLAILANTDTTTYTNGKLYIQWLATTPDVSLATPHFDDISLPIKTSQIQDGPTINGATFAYVPVSQCINEIATRSNYLWYIDQFKKLYYVAPGTFTGPSITQDDVELDAVAVTRTSPLYRNREFVTNINAVTATQTESRKGDGVTRSFTMSYPLANVPTVTVNGTAKTVGIKGVNTSGFDFYWALGDPVIAQDTGGTLLISTDTFQAVYTGQYIGIIQSDDTHQQSLQAALEGGTTTGIVEDAISAPEITSVTEGFQRANGLLAKFSQSGLQVSFKTGKTGIYPGQLITVTLSDHNINAQQLLVENIAISDSLWGPDDFQLTYTVTCIVGPTNTTWTDFFTSILNKGNGFIDSINLGSNATLTVGVPFTENWSWGETITETVYACPIVGTATVGGAAANVC